MINLMKNSLVILIRIKVRTVGNQFQLIKTSDTKITTNHRRGSKSTRIFHKKCSHKPQRQKSSTASIWETGQDKKQRRAQTHHSCSKPHDHKIHRNQSDIIPFIIIQMLTEKALKERELDQLYDWVDSLQLSRPKKNISRDFSDGTMMAEVIYHQFPKIIELHNYPPTNAIKSKLANWTTLNNKVLSKIGLPLSAEDCKRLSSSTPGAVEALLLQFKNLVMQNMKEKRDEQRVINDQGFPNKERDKDDLVSKLHTASKVEELREVLALIKEKISLVERSIDRKDTHIRELEEILKQYSN